MYLRHHFLTGSAFEWPNASNTGYAPGTVFTPYADFPGGGPDILNEFNYATYFPDKVCRNFYFEKSIGVRTPNFSFINCLFHYNAFWGIDASVDAANLTVIDCEFRGMGFTGVSVAAIIGQGWFERVHGYFANMAINVMPGATTVKSCYFHDMQHNAAEPHWDGLFVGGAQTDCLFMNNLFHLPDTSGTAAIFLHTSHGGLSSGPIRMIHNRCLGQPSYAIYCTAETLGDLPDVTIINNQLQRGDFGYILTENAFPIKDGNVDAFTGVNIDSYDP